MMRWVHIIVGIAAVLSCFSPLVHAENSSPFTKLDSRARELPHDADAWAMVRDNTTGLIWEVKTTDRSIHDNEAGYNWAGAHDVFIARLNEMRFGTFSDWRLPTTDELRTIRMKGAEPYINQDFFPNTVPSNYMSWRKCGSGDIYSERVKFGESRNSKTNRQVRAVRGGAVTKAGEGR
jgi:hypothetical protein